VGSGSESEGLHIASYAPSPRLPQDRLFSLSPRTGLCMAGGTLLTLAGSPVNFFHQGRGPCRGPWLGKEKLTSGPRQEATAS